MSPVADVEAGAAVESTADWLSGLELASTGCGGAAAAKGVRGVLQTSTAWTQKAVSDQPAEHANGGAPQPTGLAVCRSWLVLSDDLDDTSRQHKNIVPRPN